MCAIHNLGVAKVEYTEYDIGGSCRLMVHLSAGSRQAPTEHAILLGDFTCTIQQSAVLSTPHLVCTKNAKKELGIKSYLYSMCVQHWFEGSRQAAQQYRLQGRTKRATVVLQYNSSTTV